MASFDIFSHMTIFSATKVTSIQVLLNSLVWEKHILSMLSSHFELISFQSGWSLSSVDQTKKHTFYWTFFFTELIQYWWLAGDMPVVGFRHKSEAILGLIKFSLQM